MEPSLFSGLFKQVITSVITVGSMFYSTIDGVHASFDNIKIYSEGSRLYVSTRLRNCYTDDFEKFFASGKRIYFHYRIEVFRASDDISVYSEDFFNAISYSHLDNIYEVYQSHTETFTTDLDLQGAKTLLAGLQNVSLVSLENLDRSEPYTIKITSWLDRIKFEGMEEPLNLMYYWNSIPPVGRSKPFSLLDLNQ